MSLRDASADSALRRVLRRATIAALIPLAAPLASAFSQVGTGNGFLIGTPAGSFTVRGGWALASARSDIFSFTTKELTLDRGDFSSPIIDVDLAVRVRPRTDVVVSTSVASISKRSEFRGFIDDNDQPIEQRTVFNRVPVTVSVKQYLGDRGRSVGRYAWIPTRFAPYVGAGGGAMWYRFRQTGDFIDFKTNDVFGGVLGSEGWTPTVHALAGAELTVNPRFAIVTEARYGWSKAKLQNDFSGFDRIDLSGLSTTAGVAVRF